MTIEKKNNIHQTLNTILLTCIGIVAGLIYSSNVRITNKLDSLTLDNQQNKTEIEYLKNNYTSKLEAEREHNKLIEKYFNE